MAPIRTETPKSLPEFVEIVERAQTKSASGTLWYRGCGSTGHRLLPSLYRHRGLSNADQFADLERQLLTRFRQRSVPYHNRPLTEDLETLFFMQHYGVPTRLLDWTENPVIALHFALMSAQWTRTASNRISYDSDAIVWVLDPVAWNQHALRHISYNGGVLTPDDDAVKVYRPSPKFAGMHNQAIAIFGAHNSARIVAQQGVFVLFGKDGTPMEQAFKNEGYPGNALTKVIIKKSVISAMRKSLLRQGFTESTVFPDLEGLAREIKRTFGFED